jgi:hypothetical protein
MTEADWLYADKVDRLIEYLFFQRKTSDRRLRLFACACCRQVERFIEDFGVKETLRLAEDFADHDDLRVELQTAITDARRRYGTIPAGMPSYHPADAAREAVLRAGDFGYDPRFYEANDDHPYLLWAAIYAQYALEVEDDSIEGTRVVMAEQVNFLHDIIGNPFCPMIAHPSWLVWGDSTVVKLAQGIYDERAFGRLPVLADALEEAGCDNAEILAHCRGSGPHVRGCWVVDLLLGKE